MIEIELSFKKYVFSISREIYIDFLKTVSNDQVPYNIFVKFRTLTDFTYYKTLNELFSIKSAYLLI